MNAGRTGARSVFTGCAFLALSILLVFGSWAMGSATVERDVPYVPTPMDVVYRMISMADVGPEDVVYDLGCGDGRIVNTAARERGARGVGIDIDPQRIAESKANAQAAGVSDRVVFLVQDLFEAEISDATVVMLYLLPRINVKLRPMLFSDLRPGTRIVSHSFDMGTWQPDRVDNVDGRDILFWLIPANMTGTWRWSEADGTESEMVVEQRFQRISGEVSAGASTKPLIRPLLSGDQVEFSVKRDVGGSTETVRYQGTVQGDSIRGHAVRGGHEESWTANRVEGTQRPLEEMEQEQEPEGLSEAGVTI
jgi:SAM-dependent methyltransferase